MSEGQKQQQKQKPLHEGKEQKPSTDQVCLDNADTVIDGGPVLDKIARGSPIGRDRQGAKIDRCERKGQPGHSCDQ
jgi:hypothetical protein